MRKPSSATREALKSALPLVMILIGMAGVGVLFYAGLSFGFACDTGCVGGRSWESYAELYLAFGLLVVVAATIVASFYEKPLGIPIVLIAIGYATWLFLVIDLA